MVPDTDVKEALTKFEDLHYHRDDQEAMAQTERRHGIDRSANVHMDQWLKHGKGSPDGITAEVLKAR